MRISSYLCKKKFLIIWSLGIAVFSYGQNSFKKNDIYLEAFGNGLFGSVNYERQLTKMPGLGARIGVGFYTEKAFYLTIPIGINYLFPLKKSNSFLDAGLGGTWAQIDGRLFSSSIRSKENNLFHFIPSIGYRQHTSKNVMWRISLTPVINKNTFVPSIGASIGKRF